MELINYKIAYRCIKCNQLITTAIDTYDFDPDKDNMICPKCKKPMDAWEVKVLLSMTVPKEQINMYIERERVLRLLGGFPVYVCLNYY